MTATPSHRIQRTTRFSRIGALILLLVVVALIVAPWWADRGTVRTLTEFMYFLALAQLWNLLAGYGGMVSVGQQGFVGIGAYALVALSLHGGIDPFLAIPLVGLIAMLLAIPTAALTFRLHGAYFAVGTWVVAEVFRLLVLNSQWLGAGSGISLARVISAYDRVQFAQFTLWTSIVLGVGSCVAVYALLCTRPGLALTALRDNAAAAGSVGVRVRRMKWIVFLAASGGCGMVGALYALQTLFITPSSAFTIEWTAFMIFIVVIGGIGTIEGPIIGTLIFFALRGTLAGYGSWYLIVMGTLAIVVMMVAREGLWGVVGRRFDLYLFPTRRRVMPPQPRGGGASSG